MVEAADLARRAVEDNLPGLSGFLRRHAPFDQLTPAELRDLLEHCRLAYVAAGETIAAPPQDGPAAPRIVYRGRLLAERAGQPARELGPGELFGLNAGARYRAVEDGFYLELEAAAFDDLLQRSAPLADYCRRRASALQERAHQRLRESSLAAQQGRRSLDQPLSALALRPPIACSRKTAVSAAVRQMHETGVGSIVVIDAGERPLGIFTLNDLRRLFAADCRDFDQPIEQVMTPQPRCLPRQAPVFDAMLVLAHHGFHHLCLLDGERLAGVVSEQDLFGLQRMGLVQLARRLQGAAGTEELGVLRPEIHRIVGGLLAQGASAAQILRMIAVLDDHLTARSIELSLREAGYGLPSFTWLAVGAAARLEQPLHAPQANAVLFADEAGAADAVRARLLPLAARVNHALARCGLAADSAHPLAGEAGFCLNLQEWQQRLAALAAAPSAPAQLAECLELRPVLGPAEPARRLREQAAAKAAADPAVLRALAARALAIPAPERDAEELDLGTALEGFAASVRVLALSQGIGSAATSARLAGLSPGRTLDPALLSGCQQALEFLQLLRLHQHQQLHSAGQSLHDRLRPARLEPLERRVLAEALHQLGLLRRVLAGQFGAVQ